MIAEQTYRIEDFISELSVFSFADVLVHLEKENRGVFILDENLGDQVVLPYSGRFNQIYKIAVQHKKTSDIQSLCATRFLIHWKVKERRVATPLLLVPVHCSWNKVKQEFRLQPERENTFVNPFIVHYLHKEFGLEIPSFSGDEQDVVRFLQEAGFELSCENFQAVGNFHYHRFELIKDLEEMLVAQEPNALVKTMLGEASEEKPIYLDLDRARCFESDRDQEAVFTRFREENLVLQGPPGTGKTQVLSNLIAKLLKRETRQLVVSEKKTALEVLEKKLKTRGLHHFVFLSHAQSKASDFVARLKSTWDFLEKWEGSESKNLGLSEQYLQQIQLTFDKLNGHAFLHERTLEELQAFTASKSYENIPYISELPGMQEWKTLFPLVDEIYGQVKSPEILGKINSLMLKPGSKPDELLEKTLEKYRRLREELTFENLADLRALNRKAIVLQVLRNEQAQKYAGLLHSEKEQKKYEKLKKQYRRLSLELEAQSRETVSWKTLPSLSEVESWQHFLNESWLVKRKTRKHITKLLKPVPVELNILLDRTAAYLRTAGELAIVSSALLELGIERPEFELNIIDYVLSEKNKIAEEEWLAIREMKSKDQLRLLELAPQVKSLLQDLEDFFRFETSEELATGLANVRKNLDGLCSLHQHFQQLPPTVYRNLHCCRNTQEFGQLVLKSNWVAFASAYPELARFNAQKLTENLASMAKEEELEQTLFARQLVWSRKQTFARYHELLQLPSTKLKAEQKQLKAQLKAGKAILVKEFAKSRQHKSMRELMSCEARLWIDLLIPVQLSTPAILSRNIPLEKGFFECVIFDEASQLALPKAISSLQRGRRMLVAGDSQQMSPGAFFSGMRSGVDLLHQASYYLKQQSLKHHYRSVHSELIRFSNRHFYKDELIVYPSAKTSEQAVNWHYIENGIFDERQNLQEAEAVARQVEQELKSSKTLGVVAFSEHQLSCIWNRLSVQARQQIEERMHENRVFFKALEQVQGEECETLLISLGYGRNNEGQFHHRFGPLNQKNGTKRLNVLFTRAIEQIHFFSSVHASDFQLSANEAINLLRLYLFDLEAQNKAEALVLPFGMTFSRSENQLFIPQIYRQLPEVSELSTFHEVMQKRGWEIRYII